MPENNIGNTKKTLLQIPKDLLMGVHVEKTERYKRNIKKDQINREREII